MGFWIVDEEFSKDVEKLGVYDRPRSSQLINHLKVEPPSSSSAVQLYFNYLYSRKGDFTPKDFVELSSVAFVPVGSEKPRLISPQKCYLGEPSPEFYSKLFDFVSFEDSGNNFLKLCKAPQVPTTDAIAHELATDPRKFFKCAGGPDDLSKYVICLTMTSWITSTHISRYMLELKKLAQNRVDIFENTMEELRTASAFIGFPYKCFEVAYSKSGTDRERENLRFASPLLRADQVRYISFIVASALLIDFTQRS
jgi:hypothetical protein